MLMLLPQGVDAVANLFTDSGPQGALSVKSPEFASTIGAKLGTKLAVGSLSLVFEMSV